MKRGKEIVKVSLQGIAVNLILVGFKMAVGLIVNSISIILDAVNNFTDALSSIVTIIGQKLSERKPDAKHPFGYGRVEYFSAFIVAMIVLVAGVMALRESVMKIADPEEADYSVAALIIILVAVIVKFFFGRYVKRKGELLHSGSLRASGVDAISDAALSFSVFVGAVISYIWHVSLEGYIGILIAMMIVRTAMEILKDAVNDIIGTRADDDLVKKVRKTILAYSEVQGVYDLALHNYGPNKIIASAHIQIGDGLKTREIHKLSRKIEVEIYEKFGIILTLGVYAANDSGLAKKMKKQVGEIVEEYQTVKQMHGFYVDEDEKIVSFDLIFDFSEKEVEKKCKEIHSRAKKMYPNYRFYVVLDTDTL